MRRGRLGQTADVLLTKLKISSWQGLAQSSAIAWNSAHPATTVLVDAIWIPFTPNPGVALSGRTSPARPHQTRSRLHESSFTLSGYEGSDTPRGDAYAELLNFLTHTSPPLHLVAAASSARAFQAWNSLAALLVTQPGLGSGAWLGSGAHSSA